MSILVAKLCFLKLIFILEVYVNKQNCRIRGSENPQVVVRKPIHPEKVTIWCGGIIGPSFQNGGSNNIAVNGVRYREMLTDFLWLRLDDLDLDELWFQQDDATAAL